ncbi:zinc finger protein 33B-like [Macrobrachium nipponense]|uniref:zinc finger protein 33B-like n=1 Tax=Macrobrachium nipponense TaxID=159736 RepID=UPI0030C8555C
MKKASVPGSKDAPPPLVLAKDVVSPHNFSDITPFILNTTHTKKPTTGPNKSSNLCCLLQTADGKKILLTSIVRTEDANPGLAYFTPLSNTDPVEPTSSNAKVTSVQNLKLQIGNKVVVCNTSTSGTLPPQQKAATSSEDEGNNGNNGVKPGNLIRPAPLLLNPVVSTSTGGIYINNGYSRFKVVGKPIPVKLDTPVPSENSKTPTKVSPKGVQDPSKKVVSAQQHALIKKGLPKGKQKEDSSMSESEVSTAQEGNTVKPGVLAKPPAYLNIQVKEEPKEEMETKVKVEVDGPVPLLEGKVKEEPSEDQDALLANDEELRDALNVATQDMEVSPEPHFFIRTPAGKLVYISPEEAEVIGLNHNDKTKDNQKRLCNAFHTLHKQEKSSEPYKVKLIPRNADIKEYISCNVPVKVKEAAAALKLRPKSIAIGKEGLMSENVLGPTNVNVAGYMSYSASPEKVSELIKHREKAINPVIINEFFQGDQRYMRIKIESETFGKDVCDIPIYPLNTYKCPYCSKFYRTKDHIISHIRIHTGERPYPCDVCGKRYRQRIDIIRHMRIHTGEKPFTCGMCNASFNQKTNLRSHMRIHTGERPVQCKVCGKAFSRNTHLKQHLKVHTGEKPYKCKDCGRMFRFKSGLQAHERIHSGVKPYACGVCGRGFTQIVGLIRHERTHTGEKPFRCINCGKSFNDLESLQLHSKKHTDDRPHTCELCKKTFIEPASLRSHIKKYHTSTLLCGICHREDFKSRIDLREHLREHERENWKETEDGDLIPSLVPKGDDYVSLNDVDDEGDAILGIDSSIVEPEQEEKERNEFGVVYPEEIQVEVELDPDNPLDCDDEGDSDYEEHDLLVDSADPLAC